MRRTGNATLTVAVLLLATSAAAAPDVQAEADRSDVGLMRDEHDRDPRFFI